MKAHQLNELGEIINTIEVDSLDVIPNLVDASIGGSIGDTINSDGSITKKPEPEIIKIVPESVTMRQARLALLSAGILTTVNNAILTMSGVDGDAARIEWEFSSNVERHKSFVKFISSQLGLSETQLDDLFILAATL